ncbi:hypothetical protein NDU88_001901 [Pleurodeles waltl]|uniref:Uncharacterized protein n=1 Tax=Pleurodeles waltl TaxID=8319 RepID=A0AAV7NG41_PLEWA|nr:hypothetical protein NDU88_001901 [Pleurodeles waltl]
MLWETEPEIKPEFEFDYNSPSFDILTLLFKLRVCGFWELGVAPGEYRQEKQKNAKVCGFWELGVAPGEYRQEKQKNAKGNAVVTSRAFPWLHGNADLTCRVHPTRSRLPLPEE